MMTASTAIEARDVSYTISGKTILSEVSFSLTSANYLSIIGPNGAGKTTLLKCLNRLLHTSSGTVEVLGKPIESYRQREIARLIGYVPQADSYYLPFSVFEFVLMGRYPHLSPFSTVSVEDKAIAMAAIEQAGGEDISDRSMHTLSGGERQKVFIAAALAQEARILLLDEPTTFLDYRHQVEIMDLMKRLNRDEGITIVAVTHDVNTALRMGGEVLGLKDGRVAFQGTPAELLENDTLESIYETPFRFVADAESDLPIVQPVGDAR